MKKPFCSYNGGKSGNGTYQNIINHIPKCNIFIMISQINKNFVIRYQFSFSKRTYLIGAGQYSSLVGQDLANKHFQDVLINGKQKTTYKLRRGLKIDFLSK